MNNSLFTTLPPPSPLAESPYPPGCYPMGDGILPQYLNVTGIPSKITIEPMANKQPHYLTAERAVEMSQEAALKEAFEAIETACKRGHYKTGFMNLCGYVAEKLRELGFTLVSAGLNYPGNYQIRWEVKK